MLHLRSVTSLAIPAHVVHQGECVIEIQTARDMSATAADSAVDARVCRVL